MATDDLLTLAEAKQYLGIGSEDTKKNALLETHITAASLLIADRVGPVVYGTVTGELHDGGRGHIYLNRHPVNSVVQVVEYDATAPGTLTAETNASHPAASYRVNLTNGKVTRRSGGAPAVFPVGYDNIYVTYVAGRVATTAAVDDRYKAACGLLLKHTWRTYEPAVALSGDFDVPQASFPRFAIPNAVKELLGDEWRSGSGVGV